MRKSHAVISNTFSAATKIKSYVMCNVYIYFLFFRKQTNCKNVEIFRGEKSLFSYLFSSAFCSIAAHIKCTIEMKKKRCKKKCNVLVLFRVSWINTLINTNGCGTIIYRIVECEHIHVGTLVELRKSRKIQKIT